MSHKVRPFVMHKAEKWLHRRWEYCPDVEPGSPEAELVDACAKPRTWV